MLTTTGTQLEQFGGGNQQGMRKKNLPSFKPARLVIGTSRTYIALKFTTKAGKYVPGKPTYGLGKVWNMEQRKRRGNQLVERINWWLGEGFFFEDFCEIKAAEGIRLEKLQSEDVAENRKLKLSQTNIIEAIEEARQFTIAKTSKKSVVNTMSSKARILTAYLKEKGLAEMSVSEFTKHDVRKYLMYYKVERVGLDGNIRNITYNNVIMHNSTMWTELVESEYLAKNPWFGQKRLPEEDKIRQPFEEEDAQVILDYLKEHDKRLYYACVIMYITGIRPVELVGLRFRDINTTKMNIRVHANSSKLSKFRWPRIPKKYIPVFQEDFWTKYPATYFVFGINSLPHPSASAGKETMKTKHKNILDLLYIEGEIKNREGYQFYSWKDTGAGDIIDELGFEVAQVQLGHKSAKTTMRYAKKQRINKKMLGFSSDLQ